MKRLIPLFLAMAMCVALNAQSRGSVQITGDTKVTNLVEKHVQFNEKSKTVPGYRLQIASLSGVNSKAQAFAKKQQFMEQYPDVTAYIVFDEPNFKVKVGDFMSRMDAFYFMQKIKGTYSCSIIKDNVFPVRWNPEDFDSDDDTD